MRFFQIVLMLAAIQLSCLHANEDAIAGIVSRYHEQYRNEAVADFLALLEETPHVDSPFVSEEEQSLCEIAKQSLLRPELARNAVEEARLNHDSWKEVLAKHPEYTLLNAYYAVACYICCDVDSFFPGFHRAYQEHPSSYPVQRTLGFMWKKLLQVESQPEQRQVCRQNMIRHLKDAVQAEPRDTQLYWMIAQNLDPTEQEAEVRWCLQQILKHKQPVPRRHVLFWVDKALSIREARLANELVDHASDWYSYSRQLQQAKRRIAREQSI